MKTLAKVGAALALLATLMTSGFYTYLKAEGRYEAPVSSADRAIKSETRTVAANVTQLEVSGPIDIKLIRGDKPGMTVRGEQRLLKRLSSEVNGNSMSITFDGNMFRSRQGLEVEMTLPALQKLTIRGSGDAHVSGFKGELVALSATGSGELDFNGQYQRVKANLHGSGNMNLANGASTAMELDLIGSGNLIASGQTKSVTTRLNGSGDIDADQLQADDATVSINGSGNTRVQAKQVVNVTLRGSGDVNVKGNPKQRNVSRTGSGDVEFE